MLKLRKVQILGFKSFSDRTEVQLAGNGIAAIVGPNGCGKSNIADAITWVLGEQSAKSLRGLKMEDVIFAGTRDRKPTGMAEVSLTLVDPEVYDGNADGSPAPDLTIDGQTVTDWNEDDLRAERVEETEEAVAEAQPGQTFEAEGPQEAAGEGAPATNVVLKIRRRKFGRTPVRAGELTVTRRLFRSGDSEYLLNGKICRLRDIQDIFMGTGLGGETYAIIGQERIGQLLSSKPQERRSIIEEAAGITRFKTKKRLAELRLESARGNLSRVNDIFEEVTKQMGTLKRQAAKAERYGEIRTELRTRLRVVLKSRLGELDRGQRQAEAEVTRLSAALEEKLAVTEIKDAEHAAGMRQGYELEGSIRESNSTAHATAVELERIHARVAGNADRIAELLARLAAGAEELEGAQGQLQQLANDEAGLRAFLERAHGEAEQARAGAAGRALEAGEAARAVSAAEQAAESNRQMTMRLLERAHKVRQEQVQAEAGLASLERESERLEAESATAHGELEALGHQRGQLRLSHETVSERLKRLEIELSELRLTVEARRREEAASKRKGDGLRGELAGLKGRRDQLEGLIRDHAYSTDTVKNVFRATQRNAHRAGEQSPILGTLADFLEVDGAYEQVVDEFLRDELNYVVVRSWDAADEGIRLLKAEVAGRATFLVEPDGAEAQFPLEPEERPGVEGDGVRPLRECITVLNGFGRSLEVLLPRLRDGYIVPEAEAARRLALKHPDSWFLAPGGETFRNLTVAGGRPSSGGPLALKRELRELQERLTALEDQLAATDTRTGVLQHELAEGNRAIESRNGERREAEREAANSGAALRQMESETARIERRLQEWMLYTDRNRDARNAKLDLIDARKVAAAALDAEHATLEVTLQELTAQVNALRADRETMQQAAAAAAAALAGLEERRRNAQANFDRTAKLHAGLVTRIAQLQSQLAAAGAERTRREEESAALAGQQEQLAERRATAVAEGARYAAEAASLRAFVATLDGQLRALRAEVEQAREGRAGHVNRLTRLVADLEYLEAACLDDLAVTAAELRADSSIEVLEGEPLARQEGDARELKRKLEAMGPVNMMALEEFAEAGQRHAFLDTQRKDLLDSIGNTQQSIKEIDEVSRQKFDEAYLVINENFTATFTKLFGGGQATMRLTEELNAAEAGIEIVASPPGKKLQNILLLSGGEKALTALSLLVGIFQFQPAPFCILDEVDAPLDETNVVRFAKMIAEMSAGTQFIAITHNKRTMAEADVIYGVTMQEPGVSKIVSVNLGQSSRSRAADRSRAA